MDCEHIDIIENNSFCVCMDCGVVLSLIEDIQPRVNKPIFYTKDNNFKKLMIRYNCLQRYKIEELVLSKIKKIVKYPINVRTVNDSIKTLQKKHGDFGKYYNHMNLIVYKLNGYLPEDIFDVYELLMKQFEILHYDYVQKYGYKNFISYNITLYFLLQYNCKKVDIRDFKIVINDETRKKHINIFNELFQKSVLNDGTVFYINDTE